MDQLRIVYFIFLTLSLVLSIICHKSDKSLKLFPYLLSAALLSDLLTLLLVKLKVDYHIIYHIYLPIEYCLLSLYFYLNINKNKTKKIILYSIPLFIVISLFFSFKLVDIQKFPNFQTNIEGLLLIIWATLTLFNIEIKENLNIVKLPVFWICVAVLIYNCGIFSYIGVYNYICESSINLSSKLEFYILKILNYLLYTLFSVAFICSHKIKKYL